jgi:hypothetical protein
MCRQTPGAARPLGVAGARGRLARSPDPRVPQYQPFLDAMGLFVDGGNIGQWRTWRSTIGIPRTWLTAGPRRGGLACRSRSAPSGPTQRPLCPQRRRAAGFTSPRSRRMRFHTLLAVIACDGLGHRGRWQARGDDCQPIWRIRFDRVRRPWARAASYRHPGSLAPPTQRPGGRHGGRIITPPVQQAGLPTWSALGR